MSTGEEMYNFLYFKNKQFVHPKKGTSANYYGPCMRKNGKEVSK